VGVTAKSPAPLGAGTQLSDQQRGNSIVENWPYRTPRAPGAVGTSFVSSPISVLTFMVRQRGGIVAMIISRPESRASRTGSSDREPHFC
jgi:hypothetical protein